MPETGTWPTHVIDIAVEARSPLNSVKLADTLRTLAGDGSFSVSVDEESGQVIVSAATEDALDALPDRLKAEFGIALNIGAPQVAYREAITRTVEHDYTHKKQSGGSGQFARIKFRIEPNEPGAGFEFKSEVVGGNVPKEYVPSVQKGVASVMGAGPLIGFPIVDVKFILTDGAYHDVDSSVLAFEIAARAGFKDAIEKASPKILEPIMNINVVVPTIWARDVVSDLNKRRGQSLAPTEEGAMIWLTGKVPLANMFGYVNSLRVLSRSSGRYDLSFSHYDPVPGPLDPDDRFRPAMAMRA